MKIVTSTFNNISTELIHETYSFTRTNRHDALLVYYASISVYARGEDLYILTKLF